MGYFEDQMERFVYELDENLKKYTNELAGLPEGRIWRAKTAIR